MSWKYYRAACAWISDMLVRYMYMIDFSYAEILNNQTAMITLEKQTGSKNNHWKMKPVYLSTECSGHNGVWPSNFMRPLYNMYVDCVWYTRSIKHYKKFN